MPILTPASDASGAFESVYSMAGMAQVLYPPTPFPNPIPTVIAAGATWISGLMFVEGYRYITLGMTSSQAGSLIITEFLDLAGLIPRPFASSPFTTPIVAATALIVDISDLKPFVTMTISISNTGGSAAVISPFQLILAAG